MTTSNSIADPQAIAERQRDSFEAMARARAEYPDAYKNAIHQYIGHDTVTHAREVYEAITGDLLPWDELPEPADLEPWLMAGEVLDVELHGHRSCSFGDWTVDEVQFVTCTGGPHVEIVYEPGRECGEIRCYWSGQGRAAISDPSALALLEAAAELLEVA